MPNEVISNMLKQDRDSLIYNPDPSPDQNSQPPDQGQAHTQAQAQAQVQEEVHYRVVAEDELVRMKPLFDQLGWATPDPNLAKVVVVEAGLGKDAIILGFCAVQYVTHMEPFWIHPNMRGSGVAEALMENAVHYVEHDCNIKKYVSIAKPGSFGARLCEANGMVPFPGQVYVKQIEDRDQ
jgi:ribosomal protein S18 acetylase RimI-like enzyme